MSRLKKKIIVTSFASNVARMESIFYCAEKIGRQISLVGRSMHRIYKAAKKCGYLNDIIEPIDSRDAKNISREKIVYLCTGSQGEPHGLLPLDHQGYLQSGEPGHAVSCDSSFFHRKLLPQSVKRKELSRLIQVS